MKHLSCESIFHAQVIELHRKIHKAIASIKLRRLTYLGKHAEEK